MKHLDESQLTAAYFGDEGPSEGAHLDACADCRREYGRLAAVLDAMREVPVPEPSSGWEGRLWRNVEPEFHKRVARRPGRAAWQRWWVAPAFAALLMAAFLAGRFTGPTRNNGTPSGKGRERVLLIALGDHLDRSQIVLAELVNAPEGKQNDISAEQKLASQLIGENRLLRQTAARTGERSSAALLDQLERVLLDIAHSPSSVTPEEMNDLRSQIESQGLLFKIRILGSNAKAKGMKL